MYYLRTKAAANAIQFTVDKSKLKEISKESNTTNENGNSESATPANNKPDNMATLVCSINNKDDCLMCGS